MAKIDQLLANNARYAASFDRGGLEAAPRLRLAVLSCMDARLDLHRALGLAEGDAHVIRNAGGIVTDDAIRSLAISQRLLGTEEIAVIHHTRCGMLGLDDERFAATLEQESGARPPWAAGGFADLEEDLRACVERIRRSPFIARRDCVRGFIYDVDTGEIREVAA